MIVLQGFSIDVLKRIFEDVEYDIELLHEEKNGDFLGLAFVLSDDKLHIVFRSDNDEFDYDVSPWTLYLDKQSESEYKVGYIEEWVVYDIIDKFKTHDTKDLKVVIDDDLEELKIYNNDELVLKYRMQ